MTKAGDVLNVVLRDLAPEASDFEADLRVVLPMYADNPEVLAYLLRGGIGARVCATGLAGAVRRERQQQERQAQGRDRGHGAER